MSEIVLVCGGRDYKDRSHLRATLYEFHMTRGISLLVHGAAGNKKVVGTAWPALPNSPGHWIYYEGADLLAEEWAIYNSVPYWPYPVTREERNTLGKKAGPLRNQRMLDERKPSVCIAFHGGRGTADMVERCRKVGLEVLTA